jgi:hypothetical protein
MALLKLTWRQLEQGENAFPDLAAVAHCQGFVPSAITLDVASAG